MTFAARFHSKCAACGEGIRPDDLVTWSAEMVVHEDCPEPVDSLAVTREPCGRCFMVPANNGECGCDQ